MIEDIKKIAYNHGELKLDYSFNSEEIYFLAMLLRKNESELPDALTKFCKTIEQTVYNSMSIDEALKFYS